MSISGRRIAILGLGRTGLAVGEACLRLGAKATIYDEAQESALDKPGLASEARRMGLEVVLGVPLNAAVGEIAVVNPAIDHRKAALGVIQSKGIELWSEIEFAYRISKAPIIAITGSNGKSTTACLVTAALNACWKNAVLCGNIYGSGFRETPLTKAALEAPASAVLVAEISSFQLEWVREFRPQVSAITTVTAEHQNRYDSFDQYRATKVRIFNSQRSGDYGIFAPESGAVIPETYNGKVLTCGAAGSDSRTVANGVILNEIEFAAPEFRLLGRHNLTNIGMAALCTLAHLRSGTHSYKSIPAEAIRALREFPGLAHRMELVAVTRGITFINNSMCTNPEAIIASVSSLDRRQFVLIGGVNKELDFSSVGQVLKRLGNTAICFGQDGAKIASQMAIETPVCVTMKEAFDLAVASAKVGDIVMLAPGCASSDQFHDFRHRGRVFRSFAKDW